jgi:CHASE3 domain sensor protein
VTGQALDDVIARVQKATTERQQLQDKLFDLTATDAQKLARTRDLERAAIDATNRALLEQVYAQQDLADGSANL